MAAIHIPIPRNTPTWFTYIVYPILLLGCVLAFMLGLLRMIEGNWSGLALLALAVLVLQLIKVFADRLSRGGKAKFDGPLEIARQAVTGFRKNKKR